MPKSSIKVQKLEHRHPLIKFTHSLEWVPFHRYLAKQSLFSNYEVQTGKRQHLLLSNIKWNHNPFLTLLYVTFALDTQDTDPVNAEFKHTHGHVHTLSVSLLCENVGQEEVICNLEMKHQGNRWLPGCVLYVHYVSACMLWN